MSALSIDAVIEQLSGNLPYELERLNTDAPPTFTAEVIGNWLSSAIISAEIMGLIDRDRHLTSLGYGVVRRLQAKSPRKRCTAQQLLRSGRLGIVVQATLLLINPDDVTYIIHIIGLSDQERNLLDEMSITDEGGNLTALGVELVRDLKWIHP